MSLYGMVKDFGASNELRSLSDVIRWKLREENLKYTYATKQFKKEK